MSDHYHYQTPQRCYKCDALLDEFFYDKYLPGYKCPNCGWVGTKKDLRTQRVAYEKLAEWNRKVSK